MKALWPDVREIDDLLLKESEYLTEVSHDFRVRLKKMLELREKVGEYFEQGAEVILQLSCLVQQKGGTVQQPRPEYGIIYVADGYPSWQALVLTKLQEMLDKVWICVCMRVYGQPFYPSYLRMDLSCRGFL